MGIPFGMPGPGGSMGICALCGENFLTEIIMGKKVKSFYMGNSNQTFFGHDKCLEQYHGKDFTDLPESSPLRQAWEKQRSKS
jgi:hypothetical protein